MCTYKGTCPYNYTDCSYCSYYRKEALNKAVCTRDYSVKHCGNCTHLIFKNYKNCSGTCFIHIGSSHFMTVANMRRKCHE